MATPIEYVRVNLGCRHVLVTGQHLDRADMFAPSIGVSPSTLSRVLNGSSRVTPEMALLLSKALGRSPESWLAMQSNHDLWAARQTVNLDRVAKLGLRAA